MVTAEFVMEVGGIIIAVCSIIGGLAINYFRVQLLLEKEKYVLEKRLVRLEALCFKHKKESKE